MTRDLKLFAFDIHKIAEAQPLPEYGVQVEYRRGRHQLVTLYRDKAKPCRPPRGRRLKAIQADSVPLERPAWLLAVGRELERQWPGEAGEALLAECLHSRPTDAREGLLDAFIAAVRAAASEPSPST